MINQTTRLNRITLNAEEIKKKLSTDADDQNQVKSEENECILLNFCFVLIYADGNSEGNLPIGFTSSGGRSPFQRLYS